MPAVPVATDEAARIVILRRGPGVVDVAAPMKYKDLCADLIRNAALVMKHTPDHVFKHHWIKDAQIIIVMNMAGVVDVGAPLPSRELCAAMLEQAKVVIADYDDGVVGQAFSAKMTGT